MFISPQDEQPEWELKIGHITGDHATFQWIRPIAIWLLSVFENTAKLGKGPYSGIWPQVLCQILALIGVLLLGGGFVLQKAGVVAVWL